MLYSDLDAAIDTDPWPLPFCNFSATAALRARSGSAACWNVPFLKNKVEIHSLEPEVGTAL